MWRVHAAGEKNGLKACANGFEPDLHFHAQKVEAAGGRAYQGRLPEEALKLRYRTYFMVFDQLFQLSTHNGYAAFINGPAIL